MSIRSEFQRSRFGFTDVTDADVYRMKFVCVPVPVIIVYRWIISLYFIASLVVAGIDAWDRYNGTVQWFIYLTNWTWLLCLLYYVSITLASTYHYIRSNNNVDATSSVPSGLSKYTVVVWILFDMSLNVSIVLMILFWSLIVTEKHYKTTLSTFRNVNEHLVNVILLLIDFVFHRTPVRILHIVYPVAFAVTYLIFSVIYTLVTKHAIYPILDFYAKPGWAVLYFVVAIVIMVLIIQPFLYALCRLKGLCCGVNGGDLEENAVVMSNKNVESGNAYKETSDLVSDEPVTRYVEETH